MRFQLFLKKMGLTPACIGYNYLFYGILIALKDPVKCDNIAKDLYVDIAKCYNVTPAGVERSIRTAIEVAALRGDVDFIYEIFNCSISPEKGKPTNKTFICVLVKYFQTNYELTSDD